MNEVHSITVTGIYDITFLINTYGRQLSKKYILKTYRIAKFIDIGKMLNTGSIITKKKNWMWSRLIVLDRFFMVSNEYITASDLFGRHDRKNKCFSDVFYIRLKHVLKRTIKLCC